MRLELVLRYTVQQRDFFDNLMDGGLDGWMTTVQAGRSLASLPQIQRYDCDTVRELLCIHDQHCRREKKQSVLTDVFPG